MDEIYSFTYFINIKRKYYYNLNYIDLFKTTKEKKS